MHIMGTFLNFKLKYPANWKKRGAPQLGKEGPETGKEGPDTGKEGPTGGLNIGLELAREAI